MRKTQLVNKPSYSDTRTGTFEAKSSRYPNTDNQQNSDTFFVSR